MVSKVTQKSLAGLTWINLTEVWLVLRIVVGCSDVLMQVTAKEDSIIHFIMIWERLAPDPHKYTTMLLGASVLLGGRELPRRFGE